MNDEHTVVPETAGSMSDYDIELNGEWVSVNHEMKARHIPMACPTCGGIDDESILYFLDNGQHLYKGMCCLQFNVCIASEEAQ